MTEKKIATTEDFNGSRASIGRVVHFAEEGGPYAAIVAGVNEDDSLELATLGKNSLYFQHEVKFDADGAKGTWRWPPRVV